MDLSSDHEDSSVDGLMVESAPELYHRHAFFRQTRRGKIFKTVHEQYGRDDLGLGYLFLSRGSRDPRHDSMEGEPTIISTKEEIQKFVPGLIVVVDTNVILHNLDVLRQTTEYATIAVPQTTLLEVKANNLNLFERVISLMKLASPSDTGNTTSSGWMYLPDRHHAEISQTDFQGSPNDQNDARIRNAALFYGQKLVSVVKVILLTDDANSRKAAKGEHGKWYETLSVRQWISQLQEKHPRTNLLDQVAQFETTSSSAIDKQKEVFKPHVTDQILAQGLASGRFYKGVYRCQRYDEPGTVTIRQGSERVAVTVIDSNRAVPGDVVALEMEAVNQWLSSSTSTRQNTAPGIAKETADPTLSEMSNVPERVAVDSTMLQPVARVVGVIRRQLSNYAGSIYAYSAAGSSRSGTLSKRDLIAQQNERNHPDGSCTRVFFPVDPSCPPILVRTYQQEERWLGQRLIVALDSWPTSSPFPLGHYVRTIGPVGDKDVETQVLLHEHNIPHEPFSAAVLACLPPTDYQIAMEPGRKDFRHLPVLSIDPPNCKDIDDALHCTKLPNGNYQVGVHIADGMYRDISKKLLSLRLTSDILLFSNSLCQTWIGNGYGSCLSEHLDLSGQSKVGYAS